MTGDRTGKLAAVSRVARGAGVSKGETSKERSQGDSVGVCLVPGTSLTAPLEDRWAGCAAGRDFGLVLMELSATEQRYHAVMEGPGGCAGERTIIPAELDRHTVPSAMRPRARARRISARAKRAATRRGITARSAPARPDSRRRSPARPERPSRAGRRSSSC
jgi:hypothetical protein